MLNTNIIRTSQPLPTDCPKFPRCSAPICPFDQDWRLRVHFKGERICFFLTELVKAGGRQRLATRCARKLAKTVAKEQPAINARFCEIRYQLKRSAKTGPSLGRHVGARKQKAA